MKEEDRIRIEKELYKAIDTFTGNREIHTPALVNDIMKIIIQERNKTIDKAINAMKLKGFSPDDYNGAIALKTLESLKT